MFELPSARTFIAGGNEFLFARFYDVYEGVQLVQLENPPIVSGVPDMHPSDSQNVEETRNLMPATAWKKYTNFAPKNLPPSVYSGTFLFSGIPVILLIPPKRSMLIATIPCGRQTTFPSALPPL